jgi:hypothetical protein
VRSHQNQDDDCDSPAWLPAISTLIAGIPPASRIIRVVAFSAFHPAKFHHIPGELAQTFLAPVLQISCSTAQ